MEACPRGGVAQEERGGSVGEERGEELVREWGGEWLVGRRVEEGSLSKESREEEGVEGPVTATGSIRSADVILR